jgi:hypothetical protein
METPLMQQERRITIDAYRLKAAISEQQSIDQKARELEKQKLRDLMQKEREKHFRRRVR